MSRLAAWTRKPTAERGLANQCRTSRRDREDRLLPRERLAEDAGEEARGRGVRLARPDGDRRQADADAVDKALARIVGEQQLADRLLRAVARERRREILVADGFGERRAEHRDRRGEDELRHVGRLHPLLPDRLEQEARAVEVDAVALVEVGLGLAGNDRGEMEDQVRPLGDQRGRRAGRREVGGERLDLHPRSRRALRARRRRPA